MGASEAGACPSLSSPHAHLTGRFPEGQAREDKPKARRLHLALKSHGSARPQTLQGQAL